jgi:hypothetical protein
MDYLESLGQSGAFILSGPLQNELRPFSDQQPAVLVAVQGKLLDGHSFGPLTIGRLDAPASQPVAIGPLMIWY